jgi:hypothetical protein
VTSRHELLAEGPRTAPEPRSVEAHQGGGRLVVREPGARAARKRLSVGKLAAPLLFAVFLLAQAVDAGLSSVLVVGLVVAAVLFEQLLGRGEG